MYTPFNQIKSTDLVLIRKRLFAPWYELTGDQFVYGKISYIGFFRNTALVETANSNWQFKLESFFSRIIAISTNGQVIGKLKLGLFSKAELRMNDGFEAEFKRGSIWPATFTWNTNRFGQVVEFKPGFFLFKSVYITIDPNSAQIDMVPLLCFLGSHLIILRQRRKAAH